MNKLATLSLIAVGALVLSACGPTVKDYDGTEVQGVSSTEIWVGNSAGTTGALATVGVPFKLGIEAALYKYNNEGGFNGAQVKLKHYDDGGVAETGAAYTTRLVEDDKVFAIVGNFGTPTVGANVDYIKEKGIPMVYAATGINALYQEAAEGYNKAVMPVQPIYKTEGRVLLARALAAEGVGFGATKVGVIYTTDDAGYGMYEGVKRQAEEISANATVIASETSATAGTNHASAVAKVKDCDVIIICANQNPFGEILNYMRDASINKKVITSYVSANTTTLGALAQAGSINADRPVYTNAWLDIASTSYFYAPSADNLVGTYLWTCYKALAAQLGAPALYDAGVFGFTEEYWSIAEAIANYTLSTVEYNWTDMSGFLMSYDSYALAGYVAGTMFLDGLKRVQASGTALTWKSYIDAMESSPVDVPMGAEIDYKNGSRLGIASLALNTFDTATAQLAAVHPLTSLDDIWAAVPANLKK